MPWVSSGWHVSVVVGVGPQGWRLCARLNSKAGKTWGTFAFISGAWLSAVVHLSRILLTKLLESGAGWSVSGAGRPRLKIPVSAPCPGANAVVGLGVGMPNHPDRSFLVPHAIGHQSEFHSHCVEQIVP